MRSGGLARERLRAVVARDRSALDPRLLGALRAEVLGVVSRYLEVDESGMEFRLAGAGRGCALLASLPVIRVRPL